MIPTKCAVCQENVCKYKCPNCLIKYCSVPCFKRHKADECTIVSFTEEASASKVRERLPVPATEKDGSDTDSEDFVPQERLDDLGQSQVLLGLLDNPHLQDLILGVDSASHPERQIHKAMMEPIFVELADECLRVVEPGKRVSPPLQRT